MSSKASAQKSEVGSRMSEVGGLRSEVGGRKSEHARKVRDMFGAIASRYDFLNHLLSANVDQRWRRTCVRMVSELLTCRNPRILDIGCGTGDLSLAFSSIGQVVGCDFCQPMLAVGQAKVARSRLVNPVSLLEGDALALPFAGGTFDAVVSAFVLRNLSDAPEALREMRRVSRKGGVLAVLDFSMPKVPVIGMLYRVYFLKILPALGTLVSGVKGAYRYLPNSVQSFPGPEQLAAMIADAGFENVEYRLLSGGIAVLLLARAGG